MYIHTHTHLTYISLLIYTYVHVYVYNVWMLVSNVNQPQATPLLNIYIFPLIFAFSLFLP